MGTHETLQRGDCTIAWERFAPPRDGATPLVLLHGFGMERSAMAELGRALAARGAGAPAIGIDLRGHGETHTPARDDAHSYPAMRDDLLAWLEAEAPRGAHLIGHSMGGQVALMAAIAAPARVRSLSLIGAGPCRAVVTEKEQRSWERAAQAFETSDVEGLCASLAAAAPPIASPEDPRLAPRALYGRSRGEQLARVVRGGFLRVESNDEACGTLGTRTLLLAGVRDDGWIEPTRKLAALVPGAVLHEVPDAGHLLHLECEADCVDAIAAFLGG